MRNFIKKSKGYIIGTVFGCLLTIGLTANAAVTNMIGKAVDGQFPLLVNGVQTEKPAIVIEGTSYIPVRSAGEQFGYDISFIDSQIIMSPVKGVVNLQALEQYKADRQAAYDKLMADEAAKQKTKDDQVKAEQDALDAKKKKFEADKVESDRLRAEYDKKVQEQQSQSTPTPSPTLTPAPTK